jgi:hypothetical protein
MDIILCFPFQTRDEKRRGLFFDFIWEYLYGALQYLKQSNRPLTFLNRKKRKKRKKEKCRWRKKENRGQVVGEDKWGWSCLKQFVTIMMLLLFPESPHPFLRLTPLSMNQKPFLQVEEI